MQSITILQKELTFDLPRYVDQCSKDYQIGSLESFSSEINSTHRNSKYLLTVAIVPSRKMIHLRFSQSAIDRPMIITIGNVRKSDRLIALLYGPLTLTRDEKKEICPASRIFVIQIGWYLYKKL